MTTGVDAWFAKDSGGSTVQGFGPFRGPSGSFVVVMLSGVNGLGLFFIGLWMCVVLLSCCVHCCCHRYCEGYVCLL